MFKVLCSVFLCLSVHVTQAAVQHSSQDFAVLSHLIQQKVTNRPAFKGAALLMRGQEVLWQYQQGQHEQNKSIALQPRFFVGSISKTLAAMLVMQQVQAGTLDLQAPVQRYLPELQQPWEASVRVADLLSHTSGLVDISTQQNHGQFRYNNLNFELLGQILTAVTKRPYEHLATEVLLQCQMDHADFDGQSDKFSLGWHEEQGQLKAVLGFMPVKAQPSGGLIASAVDIALLPLCMQQLLSQTSLQQMTEGRVLRQHRWGAVYYGYGVQITDTSAGVEWSHTGYIPGYVSAFNFFPQHQLTLVVLENQSLNSADLKRAAYYHDTLRDAVIGLLSRAP